MTANPSTRDALLAADRPRALLGAVEPECSKRDSAHLQPGVVQHP